MFVEEPGARWQGFYIGGHLGYAKADSYFFDSTDGDENARNDGNLLGGLQAGYNWQDGDIVWGVQVDGSAVGLEGGNNDYIQAEVNFLGTLRGRLGISLGDIMVYGTAGVGLVTGDAASSTAPNVRDRFAEPVWVAGGGAEFALDDRVSLGGEFLYFGETGTFNGHDDEGRVEGIYSGRVFLNIAMNDAGSSSRGANISPAGGPDGNRWQGLYVGGHLGYGSVQDFSFDSSGQTGGPHNLGNFVGGLQIGYNWQNGDIVWGLEADASATGMEVGEWDYAFAEVDYLASVRGRLGVDLNQILVYGTAGVGFVGGAGASSSIPTVKDNFLEPTYVVGGGLEFALDERVSVGAETLYYGETGTFSADDDEGQIDGIWTGRVTVNVRM
ncbi:MAG: hypothetical protein AAF299_06220 [Pseudomonadota bacterium]